MLNLILCEDSAKRTEKIINKIKEILAGKRSVIVFVPEQFTVIAEKEIFAQINETDFSRVEITSFKRFSSNILKSLGKSEGTKLSEGGKRMLMYRAIKQVNDRLTVYKDILNPSFAAKMLVFYTESENGCVTADDMELSAQKLTGTVKNKLLDTALIFRTYEMLSQEEGFCHGGPINACIENIDEYGGLCDKELIFAEFLTFSPIERILIEKIFKKNIDITVAFACEDITDKSGGYGLLSEIKASALMLSNIAKRLLIPVNTEKTEYEEDGSALSYIKAHLFDYGAEKYSGSKMNVNLYAASDIYDEADHIALTISKLVRENGMRYREIAVIGRDTAKYKGVIDNTFFRYGIPCFEDKKSELCSKPLVTLCMSALSIAAFGYDNDRVLTYVKTDLAGILPDEIAVLQKYLEKWNIKHREWKNGFVKSPFGYGDKDAGGQLAVLNRLRERIVRPIELISGGKTAGEICDGIRNFLHILSVSDRLSEISERYKKNGLFAPASETGQVYEIFIDALLETERVLGKESIALSEFILVFRSVLSCFSIGKIPTSIDEVVIGDANRTRLSGIKCVFLVGMNDGAFPQTVQESGLYSDSDRKLLKGAGISFNISDRDMFLERLYAYESVCIPQDMLYLSYPKTTLSGESGTPSYFFNAVSDLLDAKVLSQKDIKTEERIENEKMTFLNMTDLVVGDGADKLLKEYYDNKDEYKEKIEKIHCFDELGTDDRIVNTEMIREIFGDTLNLSASSFECYMKCRFAYFLRYFMGLKPEQKATLSSSEIGTFVHAVLEKAVCKGFENGNLADLSDRQIEELSQTVSKEYLDTYFKDEKDNGRFSYYYTRVKDRITVILKTMRNEFKDSKFRPLGFEVSIGDGEQVSAEPIQIGDGKSVTVKGKVDRCDAFDGEMNYLRVVDYKTGEADIKYKYLNDGFNMQLFIYLFILCGAYDRIPAGGLYYPAAQPDIKMKDADDNISEKIENEFKMKGIVNGDAEPISAMNDKYVKIGKSSISGTDFKNLERFLKNCLADAGRGIYKGDISLNPYTAEDYIKSCKYCDFKTVCGFDPDRLKGREPGDIKNKDEFFEKIAQEGDRDGENDR